MASSAASARPLQGHVDTTRLHMTKAFNAAESVEQHYTSVADTYRNPHFQGIKKSLFVFLNRWYESEGRARFEDGKDLNGENIGNERRSALGVVDLACGSGEVTDCFQEWHRLGLGPSSSAATPSSAPAAPPSQPETTIHPALLTNLRAPLASRPAFIPPNRRRPGGAPAPSTPSPAALVSAFPLEVPQSHTSAAKSRDALNGGQYASLVAPVKLASNFKTLTILPTDPYTLPSFNARHPDHSPTPLPLSFAQVTAGQLPLPECYTPTEDAPYPKYDMVVCSFALNLTESEDERAERWEGKSKSLGWKLIWELSSKSEWLVVLGSNKRPEIGEGSGWERWDLANWRPASSSSASQVLAEQSESADAQESEEGLKDSAIEVRRDRVRMRVYRSLVSA